MSDHEDVHVLFDDDNVAVALRDLAAGDELRIGARTLPVAEDVRRGHKVALTPIAAGAAVTKYGHQIGVATHDVPAGGWVHSHNLAFSAHERPAGAPAPAPRGLDHELPERRTFRGIRRSDATVATRNHIAVLSSVNCSATVCRAIADRAERELLPGHPTVDGVVAVTHSLGCGMAAQGDGMDLLRRTLNGYAAHPNVGGVVVVGLGCEVNQLDDMLGGLQVRPGVPLTRLTIQEIGGTRKSIQAGVDAIAAMLPLVGAEREELPVSDLVLGLNCGGSDGWSGVTANPALGYASDLIVAQGGTSVLAETPEIYGAEDLLLDRAVNPQVARRLVDVIGWWERYTSANGESMDNNPSPGNKEGGITTILEKSLGAVAKGGHAPLAAVYGYAERISTRGFCFMDTPGYDPVSVTGLIAGGATLICFTTGRGSALGTRPAPTLKLATNSDIFARMADDMDVNCGDIVDSGVSVREKGLEVYHALLDLASGRPSLSEGWGYGENEFVPWHLGAVM